MSLSIEHLGAAGEVTGSAHLLTTSRARVLLDCGLFQGRRRETTEKNQNFGLHVRDLSAVVLSHAHIDHCGRLPLLYKRGYTGPTFCTPATRDVAAAMLEDSASIQAHDAAYIKRAIARGVPMDPVEPLYDMNDVALTLSHVVSIPYHYQQQIAPGVGLTLLDAGHVLGSSIVVLDIDDQGQSFRLVFTGDLGRRGAALMRDPEVPSGVNALLMESTYGDRQHPSSAHLEQELAAVVREAYSLGGKVIIPAFALERAQEVLYALKRIKAQGALPPLRVYVDSPLAARVTEIFRMHPECFDRETREHFVEGDSPFDFEGLSYTPDVEASKALTNERAPSVIIAAGGMCEYGRVLHHLRLAVEDPASRIVIVGFQAQHTLGRRLLEGRSRVKIFGVERDLRARVVKLDGFSAHADRDELIEFAEAVRDRGALRTVTLVHGEANATSALEEELVRRGFPQVLAPERGQVTRY